MAIEWKRMEKKDEPTPWKKENEFTLLRK